MGPSIRRKLSSVVVIGLLFATSPTAWAESPWKAHCRALGGTPYKSGGSGYCAMPASGIGGTGVGANETYLVCVEIECDADDPLPWLCDHGIQQACPDPGRPGDGG